MILGTGVDIIKIERIEGALKAGDRQFFERTFTKSELALAKIRQDSTAYFATRFAGKEAVFKTFRTNWDSGVSLNEIEILEGEFGEPNVTIYGKLRGLAMERNVNKVMLSLSYETDYAVAFAVLIGY